MEKSNFEMNGTQIVKVALGERKERLERRREKEQIQKLQSE